MDDRTDKDPTHTEEHPPGPVDRAPESPSPSRPPFSLKSIGKFAARRPLPVLTAVILAFVLTALILRGYGPRVVPVPSVPANISAPEPASGPVPAPKPANESAGPDIRLPALANNTLYEEYAADDLEEMVKQADFALFETMKAEGVDMGRLTLRGVDVKRYNGRDFHYQSIAILPDDPERFLTDLKANLDRRVAEAAVIQTGPHDYLLSLGGHATHELHISAPEPAAPGEVLPPQAEKPPFEPAEQLVAGPKIALVIDDMGESASFARQLAELPFPVTFSIWPYSTNRKTVARIGAESGNDVLLHQPMQPRGWPKVNPGRGALFANMTRDDIQATIRKNLLRVPGAKGVNNHMGSWFTEWKAGMVAALSVINEQGLFFLDSRTTSRSVGRSVAREVGIPLYRRDIFLDNVAETDAILHQLRKTEGIALTRGNAIAIGHPHAATLDALKKWADTRDTRVSVVPLTTLSPE